MFDQLLKLVQENAGEAIVKNPAIPNEQNDEAIETAAGSLFNNLKSQAGSGGIDSILDIFKGGGQASSNPMVNDLSSGVAGDLMKKFGLDSGAAGNIVKQIIPVVMDKLKGKTNDPNDSSIDLEGVIGSLTGKGGGDILGKIKVIFGS
ncbi:MAG: DUF937 domain-containing protein [Bacteroidota bacterium]